MVIKCSDTLAVVLMRRMQVWICFATFLDHISFSHYLKIKMTKTVYIVLWTHNLSLKKYIKASIISVKWSFLGKSEWPSLTQSTLSLVSYFYIKRTISVLSDRDKRISEGSEYNVRLSLSSVVTLWKLNSRSPKQILQLIKHGERRSTSEVHSPQLPLKIKHSQRSGLKNSQIINKGLMHGYHKQPF